MSKNRPLLIVANLANPISIKDPLHLDGILLAAREIREGIESRGTPFHALAMKHGVYQASAGFLVTVGIIGPVFEKTNRVRSLDLKGSDGWNLDPADHPEYVSLPTNKVVFSEMSPFRNTLIAEQMISSVSHVFWQAVGNKEEIEDLLSYVRSIGKMHKTGWGDVSEWTVEDVDADEETWGLKSSDGRPLRNIPTKVAATIGIDTSETIMGRIEPPYALKAQRIEIVRPIFEDLIIDKKQARRIIGDDIHI